VERLLAAVRPRRPVGQDHEALVAAARQVLADERDRLLVAGSSAEATALADPPTRSSPGSMPGPPHRPGPRSTRRA